MTTERIVDMTVLTTQAPDTTASCTAQKPPAPQTPDTPGDQSYALWFGNALEAVRAGAEAAAEEAASRGLALHAPDGCARILEAVREAPES
jgi:hypothetical protein